LPRAALPFVVPAKKAGADDPPIVQLSIVPYVTIRCTCSESAAGFPLRVVRPERSEAAAPHTRPGVFFPPHYPNVPPLR
jgi:hypothetical protein